MGKPQFATTPAGARRHGAPCDPWLKRPGACSTFALTLALASLVTTKDAWALRDAWASPGGLLGAGLTRDENVRVWADLVFFTGNDITVLAPDFGIGLNLSRHTEVEAVVPFAWQNSRPDDSSDSAFGNPYIGLNYVKTQLTSRWRLGAGLALGVSNAGDVAPLSGARLARALQHQWLYLPDTTSLVLPYRLELGRRLRFSLDVALAFTFPDGGDNDLIVQVAPGLAKQGSDHAFGVRVPVVWVPTTDGDSEQVGLEPYYRWDFQETYVAAHFTLNLDEPLGFSFEDGGFWGLAVEVGASL